MKQCRICLETKSLEEFYANKSNAGGRETLCKKCKNISVQKTPNRKVVLWRSNLKTRYNMSEQQYIDMSKLQNDVCAACGLICNKGRLSVDHDHACCPAGGSCGKCIRGLLCRKCNSALGSLDDDRDKILGLLSYLERAIVDS